MFDDVLKVTQYKSLQLRNGVNPNQFIIFSARMTLRTYKAHETLG